MANSLNSIPLPDSKSITLLEAGDILADARYFVLCAEMAVASFGNDDRVSAVQSATMAAVEKIRQVEDFLDRLRQVQS